LATEETKELKKLRQNLTGDLPPINGSQVEPMDQEEEYIDLNQPIDQSEVQYIDLNQHMEQDGPQPVDNGIDFLRVQPINQFQMAVHHLPLENSLAPSLDMDSLYELLKVLVAANEVPEVARFLVLNRQMYQMTVNYLLAHPRDVCCKTIIRRTNVGSYIQNNDGPWNVHVKNMKLDQPVTIYGYIVTFDMPYGYYKNKRRILQAPFAKIIRFKNFPFHMDHLKLVADPVLLEFNNCTGTSMKEIEVCSPTGSEDLTLDVTEKIGMVNAIRVSNCHVDVGKNIFSLFK